MKNILFTTLLFFLIGLQKSEAQILKKVGERAKNSVERTIENRVEREASKKTDQAMDEVFEGKQKSKDKSQKKEKSKSGKSNQSTGNISSGPKSNSDFEPGNQVLVFEDFSRDAINDFPVHWNTNSSGKVVQLPGQNGKWFELSSNGSFILENVNSLPENFTIEFDLYVSPTYTFYDAPLIISVAKMKNKKDFFIWEQFKENRGKDKRDGIRLAVHPQGAGGNKIGFSEFELWQNGEMISRNKNENLKSFSVQNNLVKVQIWRQNQRLRVYVGDEKIWDLPKAFEAGKEMNSLIFSRYEAKDNNYYYLSNLRIAVSGLDARSKLLNEGKFSTNAITFNSGSSLLKPESMAIIGEIAQILKENNPLNLLIVGHTDSDGDQQANLKLSKERAQTVKNVLIKDFNIDGSRLTIDGKGEDFPIADNNSAEGKAKNRRVEFIKQ